MLRTAGTGFGIALLVCASAVSAQSFQNPLVVPTPFDPFSVVTGDFNHDGIPDLAYDTEDTGNGTTIHILLGNGNSAYREAQDIAISGGCCHLAAADINGDGNLDLILGAAGSSFSGNVFTLIGNADGTFQAPVVSTFTPPNFDVYITTGGVFAVGDINGDGAPDLVIPDALNTRIYILLGDSTGNFQYVGSIFDGNYPTQIELADLNGDHKLDLVALGTLGGAVTVYPGNGDGTFGSPASYTLGPGPESIVLTDLDDDGHLDIVTTAIQVTASSAVEGLLYLHGNPDGTFAAPKLLISPFNGNLIDVADYNGDGISDIVAVNQVGIGVLLGKGNLTYAPAVSYIAGFSSNATASSAASTIVFGNLTGNGNRDIGMGVEGGIAILSGNSDGTFTSVPYYDFGYSTGTSAIGDFNGDGKPDIAVTVPAEFPRVLLGNGDGSFRLEADQNATYQGTQAASSLAVADFRGDEKIDLSAPSSGGQTASGTPEVFFGNGDGTFAVPVQESSGSTFIADFNGDGRSDMVSINGADITVLLGEADGSFTSVNTLLRNPTFAEITAIGDVNRDGKPDLAIDTFSGLEIWLGKGDGTFTYSNTINVQDIGSSGIGSFASSAIADLDGDGNADLVLTANLHSPSLAIFYGEGDGTFASPVLWQISHNYSGLNIADVNNDGRPDLILNDALGISVIRNLGKRSYAPEDHYIAGTTIGTVSVGDFNHDGFPDLAVTNPSGTTVTILMNQPTVNLPGGPEPLGSLAVSPEPSVDLQSFNITLTLLPAAQGGQAPTGTVSFSIDNLFAGSSSLNGGKATFAGPADLAPGTHLISAAYNGDANYRATAFEELHTVSAPVYSTSVTFTATPLTLFTSQTVHLQATVASSGPTPVGYVSFLDGTKSLAGVLLDSTGTAIFDTSLLAAGSHTIVASYQGYTSQNTFLPETFSPSTSTPVQVTVNDNATATSLSTSSSTPTSGTVLTLTAKVSSSAGPTFGGVAFYDGTSELGTYSLANGVASFSSASLATGSHTLSAAYNANATFGGSTSEPQTITVQPAAADFRPTFTAISDASNEASKELALTARVSSVDVVPRGSVTFLLDGSVLGSAILDSAGVATLNSIAAPASGLHSFYASYGGDGTFAPSASPWLQQSWKEAGTEFSLTLGSTNVTVSPTSSATILVHVSIPPGYAPAVRLACSSGLPGGYSCSFKPASFTRSGVSTLTIKRGGSMQADAPRDWGMTAALWLPLSLIYLMPVLGRPRAKWLMLLLVSTSLVLNLTGCTLQTHVQSAQGVDKSVLVVQAASGSGAELTVSSAQVTVSVNH